MNFVPLIIVIMLALLGFVIKLESLKNLNARLKFTDTYRNNFTDLIDTYTSSRKINDALYIELTEDVTNMQRELGADGIIFYHNPLSGLTDRNHQLLLNFLPQIYTVNSDPLFSMGIMKEHFMQSARMCDDMFIRHIGNLKNEIEAVKKNLFNPFRCFADGVRWTLWLPINILFWCGFISSRIAKKCKSSWIITALALVITAIGLVSSVMSIIMGWEDFWSMINAWRP